MLFRVRQLVTPVGTLETARSVFPSVHSARISTISETVSVVMIYATMTPAAAGRLMSCLTTEGAISVLVCGYVEMMDAEFVSATISLIAASAITRPEMR